MSTEVHSTTSLSIQNLLSFQNNLKSFSSMVCPQTAPQCHCLEMPIAPKAWFCTVICTFLMGLLKTFYSHKIVNPIRMETLKLLHNICSSTEHVLGTWCGVDTWRQGWAWRVSCWVKQARQRKTETFTCNLMNKTNRPTNKTKNANKQNRERLIDTENKLTTVRGEGSLEAGWKRWIDEAEKINSCKQKTIWWLPEKKGSEWEKGKVEGRKEGINGGGRRLNLRGWTHNTVYRWCIIELYA